MVKALEEQEVRIRFNLPGTRCSRKRQGETKSDQSFLPCTIQTDTAPPDCRIEANDVYSRVVMTLAQTAIGIMDRYDLALNALITARDL